MNIPNRTALRAVPTGAYMSLENWAWGAGALAVWLAGVFMRLYQSGSTRLGFDEHLYRIYVDAIKKVGLLHYPSIVEYYIVTQRNLPYSILPPMRFTYIFTGYLWTQLFGGTTLAALHDAACFFSILTLTVSFFFALRLGGKAAGIGVLALVAFAPTQIHMSQHALVDGVFTFWALLVIWSLWENLQHPGHPGWFLTYTAALAVMVMTKENAFFVFVAVAGILLVNQWAAFGRVTPRLLLGTCAGPFIGVLILVCLAGGLEPFVETYSLSVSKNFVLPFAILTGDGPWYRYLVDLFLVSPVVLILAIGELFKMHPGKKPQIYLFSFIFFSYLVMANIKYGMNLRYANMWDMPLRFLAFANLCSLAALFGKKQNFILALAVVGLCAFDLRQYYIFFADFGLEHHSGLYELVSEGLLRAVKILK